MKEKLFQIILALKDGKKVFSKGKNFEVIQGKNDILLKSVITGHCIALYYYNADNTISFNYDINNLEIMN